jgi:hypothetical protein
MDILKKGFIILTLVCLNIICACTIYRTPRVEDAFYKNYEYEFKFRMPAGWDFHKNMPDEIKEGIAEHFSEDFVVMLTNPDSRGIIVVSADKSDLDIISLGMDKEAFKTKLMEQIKEREEEFTGDHEYQDFNYEVGPLKVKEGYGPTFIYKESGKSKNGDKYVRLEYLNKCQKDCTCSVAYTLICKEEDFDGNYEILSKVADSARKVYQ